MSQNKTPAVWGSTGKKAEDLAHTIALYHETLAAHIALPDDIYAQIANPIANRILSGIQLPRGSPLLEALDKSLTGILTLEREIFFFPDLNAHMSLEDKVQLRAFLYAKQYFIQNQERCTNLLIETIQDLFVSILRTVPAAGRKSVFTVPLIYLAPNAAALVNNILATVLNDDLYHMGLCIELRAQLLENMTELSPGKTLVGPLDSKLSPLEMAHAYLRDTPLLDLLLLPLPFELNQETRHSGHWLVATQGVGKTNLILSMFDEDKDRDASIIIMDAKGDLTGHIAQLESIRDRLIVIDFDEQWPLALNPFDIPNTTTKQKVELFEYLFSGLLEAKLTTLQETLFRNVIPAIVDAIPNPTLQVFRDIIEYGPGNYLHMIDASDKLSPFVKQFMHNQFQKETYHGTLEQLTWRIQAIMTEPVMVGMFSSPYTKFDIAKEMDAGKIIVIQNTQDKLGNEGSEFFGRFIIALVRMAAQQRQGRDRSDKLPCYFYIDEAAEIIKRDRNIASIIAQCRSQNISMLLSHQWLNQIEDKLVLSALQSCAIRMANPEYEDAKVMAESLQTTPDFIRSLPVGTFATYTRDLKTHSALPLSISYYDAASKPRISREGQERMRADMREKYCNRMNIPNLPSHPTQDTPSPPPAKKKLNTENLSKHRRAGTTEDWKK